jgi:hypothetical protein
LTGAHGVHSNNFLAGYVIAEGDIRAFIFADPARVACLDRRFKGMASQRTSFLASFANAFDLFIDLRIL